MSNSFCKYFIKKIKILLIFILLFNFNFGEVKAASIKVKEGGWIELQKKYGLDAHGTSHKRTSYKHSGSTPLFCIQFKKEFSGGTYSTGKCSFKLSSKDRIIAGKIVDIIYSKSWSGDKKYAYAVAALNTYMKKYRHLGSSASFGESGTIKDAISEAKSYYKKLKDTYPKPTVTNNSSTLVMLGSGGKSFITNDKITFDNLKKDWLGVKSTYSFSITGGASGVAYYLCTDKTGKNCTAVGSTTVSDVEKVSYYVKATSSNAINKHSFTIKLTGNASGIKYYTSNVYCKGKNQAVLKKASNKKSYSVNVSTSFKIPSSDEHEIEIKKVDENGEAITGAEFTLYKSDNCSGNSLELKKNSDGTSFNYSTGVIANDNSFYGTYSFKENKSPVGYITDNKCSTVEIKKNDSTACYNLDGDVVEDKYCDSNITLKCKVVVPTKTVTDETTGETSTIEGSTTYEDFTDGGCVSSDDGNGNSITRSSVCYNSSDNPKEEDNKYCSNQNNYSLVTVKSGNVFIQKQNQKNTVIVSKKAITGDEEVPGAKLKICSKDDYQKNSTKCSASKTINDISLEWTSGNDSATFMGINPGSYVIIEDVPPAGYKLVTTVTEFSIDNSGTIKTGGTTSNNNSIVVNNELTEMTISKTDVATSKELPGATISICTASYDVGDNNDDDQSTDETESDDAGDDTEMSEDAGDEESVEGDIDSGLVPDLFYYKDLDLKKFYLDLDLDKNCIPAVLADGSDATWTSTNEPHKIVGLPAGVYYLVENISPKGYDTAESIGFIMQSDGTLLDFNGNSLADNKIVMKDKHLEQTKTGDLKIALIVLISIGAIGSVLYANNKKNNNNGNSNNIIKKIKSRKLHMNKN